MEGLTNSLLKSIENSEEGYYCLNKDWNFIYVNKTAEKTVNKSKEELIGKNIWELFPEVKSHPFYNAYHTAVETQKIIEIEEFYPFFGKWFKVTMYPDHEILTVVYRDVTIAKTAIDAFSKSEQELKFLADSIPQLVWTTLPDGLIDYYNNRWKEYIGFEPVQQSNWENVIHPEDIQVSYNKWKNSLATGEPYETEYRIRRYDGIYQWFVARAVPIMDENGKIIKWFGTATDIDQQKITDQKNKFLAEASKLLISSIDYEETLKNVAQMAVPYFADWCTVDMVEDGVINRLAVAHQEPSKVELAQELFKKFRPKLDDPSGLPNVIRTGISELVPYLPDSVFEDSPLDEESKQIFRDLSLKSYIVIPLKSHDKVVGGISFVKTKASKIYTENDLSIAEDLASRASLAIMNAELYKISRQTQQLLDKQTKELIRSNDELNNFAYIASHDLQEPLRTITSYTNLLQRRYKDKLDSQAGEFFDLVVSGATRMRNLIESLLEYSKIGSSTRTFNLIDLNKVVENVIDNLKNTLENNKAVISYDTLPSIYSDNNLISQLFQNIISNSVKYKSEKDPVVYISANKNENEWVISIKDNGIGINSQYFEKIFVIFQRLHGRYEYSGTGIGLATCKKIVEQHGGKIWLESEENQGSTFFFTIPEHKD